MKQLTVYQATMNGRGVFPVILRVDGENILGEDGSIPHNYSPPAKLKDIGTGADWRVGNYYLTYDEAVAVYIARQKNIIKKATEQLRLVGATV